VASRRYIRQPNYQRMGVPLPCLCRGQGLQRIAMNKSGTKTTVRVKAPKRRVQTRKTVNQVTIHKARRVKLALNGSNGEHTGDDDMPKKQRVKKVKRVAKRVVRKVKRVVQDGLQLSVCAAKYAIAIADPWDKNAMGACVPSFPSRPSMKTHGYLRGTVTIGGTTGLPGYGWILVSPALANNAPCIFYTTTGYSGSPNMVTQTGGTQTAGTVSVSCANLPFNGSSLTTNSNNDRTFVQGRIVASSISVRYTGTELNRGGSVYCYCNSDHSNLGQLSVDNLGIYAETEISSPASNRNKCSVTCFATNDAELAYGYSAQIDDGQHNQLNAIYPFSRLGFIGSQQGVNVNYGGAPMAIGLQGIAGTTYFFEYIIHAEYIGPGAQSMLTHNSVDFDGLAIVQTAASNLFEAKLSSPMTPMPVLMKRELVEASKIYGPAMRKAGAAMLKSSLK